MSSSPELLQLLTRFLDGQLSDAEHREVELRLREEPEARALLRELCEQAVVFADTIRNEKMQDLHRSLTSTDRLATRAARTPADSPSTISTGGASNQRSGASVASRRRRAIRWFVTASVPLAIVALVLFRGVDDRFEKDLASTSSDHALASEGPSVNGISGSVFWSGEQGELVNSVAMGQQLPGGTLEGRGPDSWVKLRFGDNSYVALTGASSLSMGTRQTGPQLYLRDGTLSASVQFPTDRLMQIVTPLGEVNIQQARCVLHVTSSEVLVQVREGAVLVRKLDRPDQITITAGKQSRIDERSQLSIEITPPVTHAWNSGQSASPEHVLGRWLPASDDGPTRLRAVPFLCKPHGLTPFTIYAASFGVSCAKSAPVSILPGSSLRVRGRMAKPATLYLGTTVRRTTGDFAGNFQIVIPAENFEANHPFDVTVKLDEFELDPTLIHQRDELAATACHEVVESFWCHSLQEPIDLELIEVELLPPAGTVQEPLSLVDHAWLTLAPFPVNLVGP